ncbi:MAG TPA: EfeM/EfeO family lipoprotein, partial [Rugosimonospora sp.]|nr:EfeM/EfeO family lipoprotein [Rugosimonospora sp.]
MSRAAHRRPAGAAPAGCLLLGGLLLGGLAACTPDAPADPGLAVSRGVCAQDWHPAHGGTQTLLLHNTGTETMEVYLVDPASGGVYAEVEALAPGTSRPMRVALGPGRYALRCVSEGSDAITGPTVTIADGVGSPAVLPVTEQDLVPAVQSYRSYVTGGLGTLAGAVADLRAAVGSGDTGRARAAWLTAHLAYQRLGAAYDTFGDLGDAIDGSPDGLPGGVADPDFTGFRRIEYGLWHGEPLPALVPLADRLVADVGALRAQFPSSRTDPNDLPLRAHEILEDGVQFELTGAADL